MDDPDWRYPWPGAYKPTAKQLNTSPFLVANRRAFDLSEVRTGKTYAALWAADFLMRQHPPGKFRVLIVASLEIMDLVWGRAIIELFGGDRRSIALKGDYKRRQKLLARPYDFYLINADGLTARGIADMVKARPDIQCLIVDEASAYRHPETMRHRTLRKIVESGKPYLWLLTGTPCSQSPMDAYGLTWLVHGRPGSKATVRDRLMYLKAPGRWLPRADADEKVARMLQPAVRWTREQCKELENAPPETWHVEPSAEQKAAFKKLQKECILRVHDGVIDAVNAAVLRGKLLQIAAGCVYDTEHNSRKIDNASRVATLKKIIAEAPAKVIVLSTWNSVLADLEEKIENSVRIDGTLAGNDERQARWRAFLDPAGPRVLLGQVQLVAYGLDLTVAATTVWFSPTDVTEHYIQANGRTGGPKQKLRVQTIHLTSFEAERKVYDKLLKNKDFQDTVLDIIREETV